MRNPEKLILLIAEGQLFIWLQGLQELHYLEHILPVQHFECQNNKQVINMIWFSWNEEFL